MTTQSEIKKAIGAHGVWKARLKTAIETGQSEYFTPETVCLDNQCNLGKWLYGATISSDDKTSPHYEKVRMLHAEFHRVAAKVLALALAGKKAEAQRMTAPDSHFATLSSNLIMAMTEWVKAVG